MRLPVATQIALERAADVRIAKLGFLAREIELERFAVARAPVLWLVERVISHPGDSLAELSLALSEQEPLAKTAPADGAPSWRIPGPGGHVRHFLALRAVGTGPRELQRAWMFGFFLRCCEDAGDVPVAVAR